MPNTRFFKSRVPRTGQKVRVLIGMARYRLVALQRKEATGPRAEAMRRELSALSWILEQVGVPPSQYDKVLASGTVEVAPGGGVSGSSGVAPLFWQRLQPAPEPNAIAVGDIVQSVHPRHRGRLYRITATEPQLCGQRVSRATGYTAKAAYPIHYPVAKMVIAGVE